MVTAARLTPRNKNARLVKCERLRPLRVPLRNGTLWDANEGARFSFFIVFGNFPDDENVDESNVWPEGREFLFSRVAGCVAVSSAVQMRSKVR